MFYPSIFLTFFDSSGRVLVLDTLTLFGIQHRTPNSRNPSILYGCWFSISLTFKIIYTINFQYELLSLNSLQRLFCFRLLHNIRYVVVKVHSSWAEFRDYFRQQVFLVLYNGLLDLLPNASLTPFVLGPLSFDAGRGKEIVGIY